MPNRSDELYTDEEIVDVILRPPREYLDGETRVIERQVRYLLADPSNTRKPYTHTTS